jgi:hypothetical protein
MDTDHYERAYEYREAIRQIETTLLLERRPRQTDLHELYGPPITSRTNELHQVVERWEPGEGLALTMRWPLTRRQLLESPFSFVEDTDELLPPSRFWNLKPLTSREVMQRKFEALRRLETRMLEEAETVTQTNTYFNGALRRIHTEKMPFGQTVGQEIWRYKDTVIARGSWKDGHRAEGVFLRISGGEAPRFYKQHYRDGTLVESYIPAELLQPEFKGNTFVQGPAQDKALDDRACNFCADVLSATRQPPFLEAPDLFTRREAYRITCLV